MPSEPGPAASPPPTRRSAPWLPALAWLVAALAVLDPALEATAWIVVPLAALAWLLRRPRNAAPGGALLLALAGLLCLVGLFRPSFEADALDHFVYARSVLFDGDLDFANEFAAWGFVELDRTVTGLHSNVHPVGPAILWTPFIALAHVYVLLCGWLGVPLGTADGLSEPYFRATQLGTATVAGLGTLALWRALSRRYDRIDAGVGLAAAVLCSPVAFYVALSPAMAHGTSFGVVCLFLAVWLDSQDVPGVRPWLALGALLGLLALVRWQDAVYAVFLLAFALPRRREGRAALAHTAAAGACALLVFSPQLFVWRTLYDRWLTIPQGSGFLDWSSPRLLTVLFGADRGLFNWNPLLLLGAAGLLLLLVRPGLREFAGAGLAVFLMTAWVNGGVKDWAASDAFGARRFSVVVPLLAVGLAEASRRGSALLARRPWLVPVGVVTVMAIWNLGLMRLYRRDGIPAGAAPAERVVAAQTRQLRAALEDAALRLGGPPLRNLVYEILVGEYFYENVNPSGTINVGRPESPYLENGWSRARQRLGWPNFRWAFFPRACVGFALREPFPLRTAVSARAPDGLEDQIVTLSVNGMPVLTEPLPNRWTDLRVLLPERVLVPGPNRLCLEFQTALPDTDAGRVAAAVSVIQLP